MAEVKQATETKQEQPHPMTRRRKMVGTVVSNKNSKTAVIKVDRRYKHKLYHKFVIRSKKYSIHDEKNELQIGDIITVVESRPLSKTKRWALQKVIRQSEGAEVLNID